MQVHKQVSYVKKGESKPMLILMHSDLISKTVFLFPFMFLQFKRMKS